MQLHQHAITKLEINVRALRTEKIYQGELE